MENVNKNGCKVQGSGCKDCNEFSFFKAPVTNVLPCKTTNLQQIHQLITSDVYKSQTMRLREILDPKEARQYKAKNFDYCTFSGTFTHRNSQNLIAHSGLLTIDFDHVENLNQLYVNLLYDRYFETQLLFRSPSGNGLKWIIKMDIAKYSHLEYFTAVANYIKKTYHVEIDKSGSDIARACFLCYDPTAYLNPNIK